MGMGSKEKKLETLIAIGEIVWGKVRGGVRIARKLQTAHLARAAYRRY
jgi:hypothetical protein